MSSDYIPDRRGTASPAEDLRIDARAATIEFCFDGRTIAGCPGESIACALFAAGVRTLRVSPRTGSGRGMFCLMGSCQECMVDIAGRRVAACQEPVRAGLDVRSGTVARLE
ncbi:MAG: (2Fe-2S)-binding protein [Casimicrobiaceae bacterium]